MFTALSYLYISLLVNEASGLCGENILWSHRFDIEDVYGIWYAVGYAQHTPDLTNVPNEIGCVTIFIGDATAEVREWLDWTIDRKSYSDDSWKSYNSQPWSKSDLAGSWSDFPAMNRKRRQTFEEKRLRMIWDENGQTMEQTYSYSTDSPGLWVAEKKKPMENEFRARGLEIWYPDDPPRHPEVVRILKVTPDMMILNYCSEVGNSGIFSLILKREPSILDRWQIREHEKQFYSFQLPRVFRYHTVCAGCIHLSSVLSMLLCVSLLRML